MAARTVVHPWVRDRSKPRFGLVVPIVDWGAVRELVQAAEDLGFDSIWMPDHPLLFGRDCWTCLAAIAAVTKRIRLGTMVSCVYYRNPVILARAVADIDQISDGRVILGLGSGDLQWEFEQMGLQYPSLHERVAVLEEALKILPALLGGEEVHFSGKTFRISGATLGPPAQQKPHVPILIAGGGERTTLRLVAQYADASNMGAASWAGGAFTPEEGEMKLAVLREHCANVGRPFETVLRTAQIGFVLAETSEQAVTMQERMTADPVRGRVLTFLENIVNFCTPDEAVKRLLSLQSVGFEYFIRASPGADIHALELFATKVMRQVEETATTA